MIIKTKKRTKLNTSADIPLELQDEIIKRLPVKSLLRFRSVSKRWRALIDSSEFINDYNVNQTQPHHLLIIHCESKHGVYSKDEYVCIVDDSHRSKLSPTVKWHSYDSHSVIVGWSHGLVCMYNPGSCTSGIVIWNPSIKKSVYIDLFSEIESLGFGVCPKTFDIKLVRIMRRSAGHYEAEVYTLRLDAWRSVSMNLTRKPRKFPNDAVVVIDGVIHWLVHEESFGHWIISFDLKSEEFREVYLPDSLAGIQSMGIYYPIKKSMGISKRNESLVILHYINGPVPVCDIWMMYENGVSSSSFIKLFTVEAYWYAIIGFRKNGQVILKQWRHGRCQPELQAYDPDSKHMNCLGIKTGPVIELASYTESLLLLNHSTYRVIGLFNEDERHLRGTENNYAAGTSTVKKLKINITTKSSDNISNKRRKH